MHSLRTPSLDAIVKVKPDLGDRQWQVFRVILTHGPITNAEIAKILNRPVNTITPRTNELVKRERVREAGKRMCSVTAFTATTWEVIPLSPAREIKTGPVEAPQTLGI